MSSRKRQEHRAVICLVQAGIAVFLLYFFVKVNPLIIFDADDWQFLGTWRMPLPLWKAWNPSRVLPETLLPVSGWVAAYCIHPFLKDYLLSISVSGAIFLTLFAAMFCWAGFVFARNRLRLNGRDAVFFELFLLLLQFTIFRNRAGSRTLFTAEDYTCVFFYTISGLVNGAVVLFLMSRENYQERFREFHWGRKLLFLLLLYAALFSNIFHSAIVTIYCGIYLLAKSFSSIRSGGSFSAFLRRHLLYIGVVVGWLVSAVFELNGQRADRVSEGNSDGYLVAARQLLGIVRAVAKPFALTLVVLLILFLIFHPRGAKTAQAEGGDYGHLVLLILSNLVILGVYLYLLNTETQYMSRIDATWGLWFWLILMEALLMAWFVQRFRLNAVLLAAIIALTAIVAWLPDGKYKASVMMDTSYAAARYVESNLVDQIIQADQKGDGSLLFSIPDYRDTTIAWSFNDNCGNNMANTLARHGIISKVPTFTTVYSSEMRETADRLSGKID
jgi:hypothetical protein